MDQGDDDDAISYLEKALDLNSELEEVRHCLYRLRNKPDATQVGISSCS